MGTEGSQETYKMVVEYTSVDISRRYYSVTRKPRWSWRVVKITVHDAKWKEYTTGTQIVVAGHSRFRWKALLKAKKAYSNVQNGVLITTDTADLLKRIQNLEHELGIEVK
jgi:hypothetical protein